MTTTKICLALAAAAAAIVGAAGGPGTATEHPASPVASTGSRHCQIPCGIYGDKMRIDMIMEDTATVEKGMKQIKQLGAEKPVNYNQIVRWTVNKDEHATRIQENIADYWLAQRIKAPGEGAGDEAMETYSRQLALLHHVIVAAMKCKQTTDTAWPARLRETVMTFSGTYFSEEDLEHLKEHHGPEDK